jgi:hypothetical protein
MSTSSRELGRVATDTRAILVIDPMSLLTDEDHAAGSNARRSHRV